MRDYKATVIPKLVRDEHPLPTINKIFAKLADGIEFLQNRLAASISAIGG